MSVDRYPHNSLQEPEPPSKIKSEKQKFKKKNQKIEVHKIDIERKSIEDNLMPFFLLFQILLDLAKIQGLP